VGKQITQRVALLKFVVLNVQVVVITLFAVFVIFRVMGKDYDAAVIAGGFCGLGVGATPVAMANMSVTTAEYGPSFKAFPVIPMVGALFRRSHQCLGHQVLHRTTVHAAGGLARILIQTAAGG
jgi:sodium--glutamate symport carrier gltS